VILKESKETLVIVKESKNNDGWMMVFFIEQELKPHATQKDCSIPNIK